MRALTLWRPWPVAMFYLRPDIRKDVENRGWKIPQKYIGQRIAIHTYQNQSHAKERKGFGRFPLRLNNK